jgi:hypothetical protein
MDSASALLDFEHSYGSSAGSLSSTPSTVNRTKPFGMFRLCKSRGLCGRRWRGVKDTVVAVVAVSISKDISKLMSSAICIRSFSLCTGVSFDSSLVSLKRSNIDQPRIARCSFLSFFFIFPTCLSMYDLFIK